MVLYVQYECDDDIRNDVEGIIDFYAGGIKCGDGTIRKGDNFLLFKDTYMIHVMHNYPSSKIAVSEISYALRKTMWGGKGRFIVFALPDDREERDKMMEGFVSVNAVEWLTKCYPDIAIDVKNMDTELKEKLHKEKESKERNIKTRDNIQRY